MSKGFLRALARFYSHLTSATQVSVMENMRMSAIFHASNSIQSAGAMCVLSKYVDGHLAAFKMYKINL